MNTKENPLVDDEGIFRLIQKDYSNFAFDFLFVPDFTD